MAQLAQWMSFHTKEPTQPPPIWSTLLQRINSLFNAARLPLSTVVPDPAFSVEPATRVASCGPKDVAHRPVPQPQCVSLSFGRKKPKQPDLPFFIPCATRML